MAHLPESITADVDTGHVSDHQDLHEILNRMHFDSSTSTLEVETEARFQQMTYRRVGTHASTQELILGCDGSEWIPDNGNNARVLNGSGRLQLSTNAIRVDEDWTHENEQSACIVELGYEGFFVWHEQSQPAGTKLNTAEFLRFGLKTGFDSVFVGRGNNFGVGWGRESNVLGGPANSMFGARNDRTDGTNPDNIANLIYETSATDIRKRALRLTHETDGVFTTGFGIGIEFTHLETGEDHSAAARIFTEVYGSADAAQLQFQTNESGTPGVAPATRVTIRGSGDGNFGDAANQLHFASSGLIEASSTGGLQIQSAADTNHRIGFFGTTPKRQQLAPNTLTDNSGGTRDQTVAAVSGSGADGAINDNFAEVVGELNRIRSILVEYGIADPSGVVG